MVLDSIARYEKSLQKLQCLRSASFVQEPLNPLGSVWFGPGD
jgi:hypothetical protein